jgi:Ca2+-binding EF-hand superfamily protein
MSTLRGALCAFAAVCTVFAVHPEDNKDPKEKKIHPGLLKKYDANQDGKLDETEKAAMDADMAKRKAAEEASRLKKFDTNKDGKIDETEAAAEKAAKEEMKAKHKAEMEAKLLEKYDTNKDGKLDEAEMAAKKEGKKKPEAGN